MNKKRILEAGASLIVGVCMATSSYAYEESTHVIITAQAVSRSSLATDPSILADIGLSPLETAAYVPGAGSPQLTASGMIQHGADEEDYVNLPQHIARVFNHFYDVQYNGYAGRGLTQYGFTIGNPSPDWALEDRGNVSAIDVDLRNIPFLELEEEYLQYGGMPQTTSFRHAQEAYYEVLTGREPAYRLAQATHMFRSLGGVVHHLQDMAQPQHVRNERHNDLPLSYYEFYTEAYVNQRLNVFLANTYPIPTFDTARQHWYSVQSSADHLPRNVGMAEFTSNNFITGTTGYVGNNGIVLPSTTYALPNGFNADGTRKTIVSQPYSITYANGVTETDTADFVIGTVQDALPVPAVSAAPRRLAMSSLLDRGTGRYAGFRTFTVSPAVFEDGYPVLLPRASAFSSGLINHFFRGRLNLTRGSNGTGWIVTNTSRSGQTMQGVLKLFYENSLGNRYPVSDGAFTINLASGASNTLNVEPPSDATKLIAAFGGQIGSEGDPSGTGFFAVAGKVVPYSRPAIVCGVGPDSNGYFFLNLLGDGRGINNGGTENPGLMEMGSTAGQVNGAFNARWTPGSTRWSVTIRRGSASGSVLYNSGYFSGPKDFSFQHPGGYDNTKVHVRVAPEISPNTTDSNIWGIQVLCPGVQFNDQNRAQPRVTINLYVQLPSGWCNTGHVDFKVDGNPAGRAYLQLGGGTGARSYASPGLSVTSGEPHYFEATMTASNTFGCGGVWSVGFVGPDQVSRTFNRAGQTINVP